MFYAHKSGEANVSPAQSHSTSSSSSSTSSGFFLFNSIKNYFFQQPEEPSSHTCDESENSFPIHSRPQTQNQNMSKLASPAPRKSSRPMKLATNEVSYRAPPQSPIASASPNQRRTRKQFDANNDADKANKERDGELLLLLFDEVVSWRFVVGCTI